MGALRRDNSDRWLWMIDGWAKRLESLRRERGLTQVQLADRSGVNVKTISSYETAARIESMKVVQLTLLCEALDVSLAEFFDPKPVPPLERKSWNRSVPS